MGENIKMTIPYQNFGKTSQNVKTTSKSQIDIKYCSTLAMQITENQIATLQKLY